MCRGDAEFGFSHRRDRTHISYHEPSNKQILELFVRQHCISLGPSAFLMPRSGARGKPEHMARISWEIDNAERRSLDGVLRSEPCGMTKVIPYWLGELRSCSWHLSTHRV
jgi:hypothetical protein